MKFRTFATTLLLTLGMGSAQAASVAVYISPQQYTHEIKLWHLYYDYWFSQGRVIEPIALDALKPVFANVALCEGNRAADAVVWIKPRMFYNPHMTKYYGTVEANVYSGSGKFIGAYKAEAERNGFLDVAPASQIKATYRDAMQQVVGKMQSDNALHNLAVQGLTDDVTAMPCGMVAVLPVQH